MNNPATEEGRPWTMAALVGLFLTGFSVGCVSQPIVTETIYEDRAAWIRLEINPDADDSTTAPSDDLTPPSSATIAALLKGLQAEKDYSPGVISFAMGKSYYNRTFVEPELVVLTPQLAKGLARASPEERVAYCLTADYSPDERFITTGWVYLKKPYLYFKLVEWRTPVRVKSPATPTSEACLVKPIPGVKTADRFFKLDYAPKNLIETYGPMGASILNKRGEVVFKLAGLALAKPAENSLRASGDTGRPVTVTPSVKAEDRPVQQPDARAQQPEVSKGATPKARHPSKPKPFSGASSGGQPTQ